VLVQSSSSVIASDRCGWLVTQHNCGHDRGSDWGLGKGCSMLVSFLVVNMHYAQCVAHLCSAIHRLISGLSCGCVRGERQECGWTLIDSHQPLRQSAGLDLHCKGAAVIERGCQRCTAYAGSSSASNIVALLAVQ
jgi:hypothetical protein